MGKKIVNRISALFIKKDWFNWHNMITFAAVIGGISLAIFTSRTPCTCDDQIPDPALQELAEKGNKQVQAYLVQTDNMMMCAALRAELLKEMKRKKRE